jgi:ribosomal-protein-alanine N-acetyltransferase
VLETARLTIRRFTADDAPFVYALYNDPDFLRYIGDRGIHSIDSARAYIEAGPIASYERHGFGLYVVELKSTDQPIGVCGILKRDALDAPDLGFAFLRDHRSRGYACEAARSVLAFARGALGLTRILAITSPDNAVSMAVLRKLGFALERMEPGSAETTSGFNSPVYVFRLMPAAP